jgi:DNA replicative helicase MCM subunit Mcm2 (Cdc46/Mcm family)
MYTVVGCRDCHGLWIVEARPETTRCRQCGKRHQFAKLRTFAETDTSEAAARVRSSMLANRADDGEFVDPEEIDISTVGVNEDEFLSASGIDPSAVSAAGKRAETGTNRSRSRKQVVLDGLAELDEPTETELKEYATAVGVSEPYVERALQKLQRAGEVARVNGGYRTL